MRSVFSIVGACLGRYGNGKTPYCVRFNPDEDKQNLFLAGCSDKKIYAVSVWSECAKCVRVSVVCPLVGHRIWGICTRI